nr:hypothetical protein [uncultured Desulfobulbus sp.]
MKKKEAGTGGMLIRMPLSRLSSVCLESEKWTKSPRAIGSRGLGGGLSTCCNGIVATIVSPHNHREVFAK